ncbi:hypothetical protein [Amycolatopsis azurea]|nr:hypothetical protein [Amycolatopsis azurea]
MIFFNTTGKGGSNLRSPAFDPGQAWALKSTIPIVTAGAHPPRQEKRPTMIVLGVIILVIGLIAGISVLTTIGAVLAVAGVVLAILGGTGRKVGGRAHWF